MNVVIIGSGLAGLTAGATLAQAGHAVSVFEQFDRLGGVTAQSESGGGVNNVIPGAYKATQSILRGLS